MNKLSTAKRVRILAALVEGNRLRSSSRMADVSINTVTKLLVDLGRACTKYQDKTLRNLPCKRLQCDEIWAFRDARSKSVPEEERRQSGYGDVWTWTAICADTKLIPSWFTGDRGAGSGWEFMQDLAPRLAERVQLATDGGKIYLAAIHEALRSNVDYATLVKLYGKDEGSPEARYGPPARIGSRPEAKIGNPDPDPISTSHAERANLTMRMSMPRFTQLTNGFSKKVENHAHALAIHFMHYNFSRVHKSLRITPAMAAGVSDHVWPLEEIIGLLD